MREPLEQDQTRQEHSDRQILAAEAHTNKSEIEPRPDLVEEGVPPDA